MSPITLMPEVSAVRFTTIFACLFLSSAVLLPVSAAAQNKTTESQTVRGLPLVFSEDFESGMDRWAPTDPAAWKIDQKDGNHFLSQFQASKYTPEHRSPFNYARLKDLDVADCVIEARLEQTGREYGHRDMVVIFGWQDPSHFYYTHIATAADPRAHSIFIVNGAPRVSIAEERTSGTQWGTGFHTVRVARDTQSGSIEVFFDDLETPIMRATDKTFTHGGVGFGTFDDTGNIDNVKIWGRENKP